MGTADTRAKNKYNAKAYDRIALQVKRGRKEMIRIYAEKKGLSLNGYINQVIDNDMQGWILDGFIPMDAFIDVMEEKDKAKD